MEYRRLGKQALKVSELSLGAWLTFGEGIDEDTARECTLAAFEAGVNYFDNADVYAHGQAEIVMGKIIKDLKRSDLVISSKVFWPMGDGPNDRGLSRKHIMESAHDSLRRLGTDYLDLYFCHRSVKAKIKQNAASTITIPVVLLSRILESRFPLPASLP